MKKNKILYGLLGLLVLVGLTYFIIERTQNHTKPSTVKIGMVTFPGYAPLYLAKEKNLFKNVDVELVRIEAIGDLRAAMQSGKIDMYIATPDIFQASEGKQPIGIGFLAIDESHGADGVAVSKDIKSVIDLKGKKVGAEPGFPPYFVLQYMLHKEGMTLKDLDFKDIASQDAGNAFVAKQLDAVGTYEPYLSKSVELRPNSKVLVSSADLPGIIVDIIFSNPDLANNNPEVLGRIADGWYAGVKYYEENKEESLTIMGKAFGVSANDMKEIKSGISWLNESENKRLFDRTSQSNLFITFDLVGQILQSNNPKIFRVSSKEKLTDKIVTK